MTSEQPPRDALRPLRPLPSIDIPLLREERSAVRNRRLVRLAVVTGALALLAGSAALGRHYLAPPSSPGEGRAPDPARYGSGLGGPLPTPGDLPPGAQLDDDEAFAAVLGAGPVEPGPAPRAAGRYQRTFGRSLSFSDALHKAGMTAEEANEVITALTGTLDFRRARPEDTLVLERGEQGELARFEFRADATVRYEATRTPSGRVEGRRVELTIDRTRVARGGLVEDSLGDALEGLKLGRTLTGVFADVFAGKVNFSTDTRRGDSFRVLLDEEYADGSFLGYGTIHALEYRGEKAGTRRAFWYESKQGEGDFYDEQGRALHGGWLRTPLRYDHVSSGFGMRLHPVLKRKLLHNGIDYCAPTGTPVRAAAAGTIRFAGRKGVNGNLLAIRHASDYETFYAHLSRFAPGIKPGVAVKQRQLVAYVGSTGRSTGPHLHFALKRRGRFLDPNSQLNGPGLPLPARELEDYKRRIRELLTELANIPLERPSPVSAKPTGAPALDFAEDETEL